MQTIIGVVWRLLWATERPAGDSEGLLEDLRTLTRYFWFFSWDAPFDLILIEGANST